LEIGIFDVSRSENYHIRNLVNMEGHCFDDQNGPNRLTLTNIINRIVECEIIGIRTKHELKFQISEYSVYVDMTTITLET